MKYQFHPLPLVEPYEYWCYNCKSMNLALVELSLCPECQTPIRLKGEPGALNLEELKGA